MRGNFSAAQREYDNMEEEDNRKFCLFCDKEVIEDWCENENCSNYGVCDDSVY